MANELKNAFGISNGSEPYKGASGGRRLGNWQPTRSGPNTVGGQNKERLDARAYDVVRNDPFIGKAVNTLSTHEVGSGIKTISRAESQRFQDQIQKLWEEWVHVADPAGVLDYNGLLMQASKARYSVGGVFIRLRRRRADSDLPVPMQLQMIETAQVPLDQTSRFGDRRVVQGIEFNSVGERTAYHMYERHPFDVTQNSIVVPGVDDELRIVRVPSRSIIHHFEPSRPGQVREVPWVAPALLKSHDFSKYEDAELVRKTIRANFTGYISREQFTENDFQFDPFTGEPVQGDGWGNPTTMVQPGTLGSLNPGEKLNMFDSDDVPEAYGTFITQQLRAMAAAMYLPYELLSGDFSDLSDRTLKIVLDQFRSFIEVRRNTILIPQICMRVWEAFVDTAVLSGRIAQPADYFTNKQRYIAADFRVSDPYKYPHIVQHREAQKLALDMNLTSLTEEAAKEGKELETVLRQKAEELKLMQDIEQEFGVELVSSEEVLKPAAPAQPEAPAQPAPTVERNNGQD